MCQNLHFGWVSTVRKRRTGDSDDDGTRIATGPRLNDGHQVLFGIFLQHHLERWRRGVVEHLRTQQIEFHEEKGGRRIASVAVPGSVARFRNFVNFNRV